MRTSQYFPLSQITQKGLEAGLSTQWTKQNLPIEHHFNALLLLNKKSQALDSSLDKDIHLSIDCNDCV